MKKNDRTQTTTLTELKYVKSELDIHMHAPSKAFIVLIHIKAYCGRWNRMEKGFFHRALKYRLHTLFHTKKDNLSGGYSDSLTILVNGLIK